MSPLIVATLLIGQTGTATPAKPAQPKIDRTQIILYAAYNRMAKQTDIWFEDGDFPKAVELLNFQHEVFPNDYETATNLGWMQENIERYEDARTTYKTYQNRNPNDPDNALPLAQHYFLKRQYKEVIPILENAVKTKSHPNMFRMLAHSYERTDKLDKSLEMWDRYLKVQPDDAPAKNNRARVVQKIAERKGSGKTKA